MQPLLTVSPQTVMGPIIQMINIAANSRPKQSVAVLVQLAAALAPFLETGAENRCANIEWAISQGKTAAKFVIMIERL